MDECHLCTNLKFLGTLFHMISNHETNYNIKVTITFKGISTMNCVLLSFLS